MKHRDLVKSPTGYVFIFIGRIEPRTYLFGSGDVRVEVEEDDLAAWSFHRCQRCWDRHTETALGCPDCSPCPMCDGDGRVEWDTQLEGYHVTAEASCPACRGEGVAK